MDKYTTTIEKDLIRELKEGSNKAFDKIYQMYSKRLYAYSIQFTKSSGDAEEIVQDVFLKLWMNKENIRQEETLRSLLFIMAKHNLINAYHSKVNHPIYEEYVNNMDFLSEENAYSRLEYDEFVQKLYAAMKKLPLTQQKVITLSRMQQLSNKEVAEELSLSEQTVKNQLSLGLKTLRDLLNKVALLIMLLFINL